MLKVAVFAYILSIILQVPHARATEAEAEFVYLAGRGDTAVVLCHGRGKHPRWKVVEPLRIALHQQLGIHTLSIQMPTRSGHWKRYADAFPDALRRIDRALEFLEHSVGVSKIYLIGHSMGGRMISRYAAKTEHSNYAGLIIIGCRNNGGSPFNCKQNIIDADRPVLDIWGDGNMKDRLAADQRQALRSNSYTQVEIPGANHTFDGAEHALISAITTWLKEQ